MKIQISLALAMFALTGCATHQQPFGASATVTTSVNHIHLPAQPAAQPVVPPTPLPDIAPTPEDTCCIPPVIKDARQCTQPIGLVRYPNPCERCGNIQVTVRATNTCTPQ